MHTLLEKTLQNLNAGAGTGSGREQENRKSIKERMKNVKIKRKERRTLALSIIAIVMLIFAIIESAEAADYAANPDGTTTLDKALGCTGNIVTWLSSHENDSYYLGTPYTGLDNDNPENSMRPNGESGGSGQMNCTGFVASVLRHEGADLTKIGTRRDGWYGNATNWQDYVHNKSLKSYKFDSISSALGSGVLRKGDILFFEPNNWDEPGADCHIGFFWGNTSNENKFWHSSMHPGSGNQISEITAKTTNSTVYVFPIEHTGRIELYKSSANAGVSKGNGNYSLAGAEYGVYKGGKMVATLTTNADGYARTGELAAGDYTIREIKTSKGFSVDAGSHYVTVRDGATVTAKVMETPQNNPVSLLLQKQDKETGNTESQGGSTLQGAEYMVKFYAKQMDTDPGASGERPIRTWVFRTDGEGKIQVDKEHLVSGDELYYQMDKSTACFPLGTVTIQETKAPAGYLMDSTIYVQKITGDGREESVKLYNTLNVSEQVIRGGVSIQKRDFETKKAEAQGNAALDYTAFTITTLNEHPVRVNKELYTKDQVVMTLYSDSAGRVSIDSDALPYGHYRVDEIKAPHGYTTDGIISREFDITENGKIVDLTSEENAILNRVIRGGIEIQKRDYETGGAEPQGNAALENTVFKIATLGEHPVLVDGKLYTMGQVVKILKTDDTGYAATEADALPYGHYQIIEAEAPAGYLDKGITSHKFDITTDGEMVDLTSGKDAILNQVVRGGVRIQKRDLETKNKKAQGGASLETAAFTVTSLCENPIMVDGEFYEKNDVVLTLNTDRSGIAVSEADALPYGHYRVDEVRSPEGYLKIGFLSREFDISEGGKIVELVEKDTSILNQIIRGDLEFVKVAEGDLKRLANVPFTITSKTTGESHTIVTDKNGYASTSSKWNKHSENTNAGQTSQDGIWFGEIQPDDAKGALLYDTYVVEEQRCKANEGLKLLRIEVEIYKDSVTVPLGTLTDERVEELSKIEIGTTALDEETQSHMSLPREKVTIVDKVEYSGLKNGEEYRLTGTLMNVDSGEPILENGEPVTAETIFTTEKSSGMTEVVFNLDATELKGATTVIYEELYQEDARLAVHADLENQDQQTYFPEIGTQAADAADGDKDVTADAEAKIVDTISFKNLVPGETYHVVGTVMDKEAGKELLIDGKKVEGETTFSPKESNGTAEVTFQFDSSKLSGRELVVYERMFLVSGSEEKLVALHEDIEDEGQTVRMCEPPKTPETPETPEKTPTPETPDAPEKVPTFKPVDSSKRVVSPKTGDTENMTLWAAIGLFALVVIGVSVRKGRKTDL